MTVFDGIGWTSELIVCDNNSTDATSDVARASGAMVVGEPINQIARARNAGARCATGDWLLFVDADSHPSPALFADLVEAIRSGHYLAGGSTVAFTSRHRALTFMARSWNAVSRINRWAAGSFIFCETAAFREAGGFNQTLYAGEEIDLSRRLKRLAKRSGQSIVILHRHPLLTSDRKAHLYTWRELLKFVIKTIAVRGRTLRSADECFAWYDGRR